jgi:hypothetical protein
MADNYLKLWLQSNLNQIAIKNAQQAIQNSGRTLPCRITAIDGSIVTVAIEADTSPWTIPPLTIPKAESEWMRAPVQIGTKGIVIPSDVYLGGISGLGGGVANMTPVGNLSALVFVPVANKNFSQVNTNASYISGPEGAVIQDDSSTAVASIGGGQVAIQGNTYVTGNLGSSTGITAVVTTPTGQTLTFTNGILTGVI